MNTHSAMLDNPAWWSLSTRHRSVAEFNGTGRIMDGDFGPFAAVGGASPKDIDDFLTLVEGGSKPAFSMERGNPFGELLLPTTMGVQMVADTLCAPIECSEIVDLCEDDAFQILDLAQRTKPGPFERRTHLLGDFIGVKRGGRLIAMAGQRLKLPGYTEISAVCVDHDHRSQGLGAALVLHMAARIVSSGDQPFLHAYADNYGAIALYQRLGFRVRTSVQIFRWDAQKIAEARSIARLVARELAS